MDRTISELAPLLDGGGTLIDGGNSYYVDDIRRANGLVSKGIHYVDVGTSAMHYEFGGISRSQAKRPPEREL